MKEKNIRRKTTKKTGTKKIKKEQFSSPKGMHDILGRDYYRYQGFFEKAQEVAVYYGFQPIELPILEQEDVFISSIGVGTDLIDKEMYSLKTKSGSRLAMRPEGTAGGMRAYIEHGMQSKSQPIMFYYYGPFFRHDKPQRGRFREFRQFGLEILGTDKSIADAVIIHTTKAILEEAGAKNICIDINSIGDKECRTGYIKELVSYYKKNIKKEGICSSCKIRMKTNPLRLLDCKNPKCQELKEKAPDSVSFLCPQCKNHFREILEYLEEMKIPYRFNKNLVRGLSYYTKTVFEIIIEDNDKKDQEELLTIAAGGRYDYLGKTLRSKQDIPSVGVSIGVDRVLSTSWCKKLEPRIIKKPKIYFIQLGFEAKLKSINIIEILRNAKIPIRQSLAKDSLSAQLATAEKLKIPYTIILGQKEALEDSVIVRNMNNRSQRTIKVGDLAKYIKNLK